MSDFKINGKELVLAGKGTIFSGGDNIDKILEADGCVYLLFISDIQKPNNVCCIDLSGNIIWKMDASSLLGRTTFANLYEENGKLLVNSWSGFECEVDRKTGKVIGKTFLK